VTLRPTAPPRIARRLMTISALASTTALVLACLLLVTYDFTTFRESIRVQRLIQANIIAANTETALVFDDPAAAQRTLSALSAAPRVEGAALYAPDGRLFASYERAPGLAPLALPDVTPDTAEWQAFDGFRYLHVVRRVSLDGAPLGVVYIRSDLRDLGERLTGYAVIVGAVILVSLLAAQLVSRVSRRAISEPIVALATVATRLSVDRDYSIRVQATGKDELGVLIAAFNEMLAQIQDRDRSLRESHELLEQRVEERTAALHQSNKELEAFCYSVSHDLRSPLRGIDGFSAALLEDLDGRLDEASTNHLHRIRAATQRMGTLIDDLLNLSRITRSEMVVKPVSLSALAGQVVADLRATAPDRAVDIRIADGLHGTGDPRLLRQVLENLIGNAWKFTSKRPDARVEVGQLASDDDGTVYFVKDNGAGFDPAHATRLFGAFQRLHAMTEFPGTGVGLAIVERVVRRHGGRVWADAAVGRGATFFFTLGARAA
jgi:signal transduction histidine kinase